MKQPQGIEAVDWYWNHATDKQREHIRVNLEIGNGNIYALGMLAAQYGIETEREMLDIWDSIKSKSA